MFLSHSRDVFSMLPWCVEERKVRGKPLSPGRGCPKDEAANPAPYPAGHDISAVRRMNRTVISAASQKPINPRCQRGHGRRGRRGCSSGAQSLRCSQGNGLCQDLSWARFQTAFAPRKAVFILMLMFWSRVPFISKQH